MTEDEYNKGLALPQKSLETILHDLNVPARHASVKGDRCWHNRLQQIMKRADSIIRGGVSKTPQPDETVRLRSDKAQLCNL